MAFMKGRATFIALRSAGKILLMYQVAISGKARSWSVAPVGAMSTITTSYLPESAR